MKNKIVFDNKTFTDANLIGGVKYIKDFAPDDEYCIGGAFCSSLDFSIKDDGLTNYKDYLDKPFRWEWQSRDTEDETSDSQTYTSISSQVYDKAITDSLELSSGNRLFVLNEQNDALTEWLSEYSQTYIAFAINKAGTIFYSEDGVIQKYKIVSYIDNILTIDKSLPYTGTIYAYRIYEYDVDSGYSLVSQVVADITDKGVKPKCQRVFTTANDDENLTSAFDDYSNIWISFLTTEGDTSTEYTDSSGNLVRIQVDSYVDKTITLMNSLDYTGTIYGYIAYTYSSVTSRFTKIRTIDGTTNPLTPKSGFSYLSVFLNDTTLIDKREILSYSIDGVFTITDGVSLTLSNSDLDSLTYKVQSDVVTAGQLISEGQAVAGNPIPNTSFNRGNFVVKEVTRDALNSKYNFKCYDKIILLDKQVDMSSLGLPDTIPNVIKKIETACGVTIQDCSNEFMMADTIEFNFTGQFTYRNLLHWIGEYTGHYFFGSKYKADGTDIYFMRNNNFGTTQVFYYEKDRFTIQATYGEIPVQPIDKLQIQSTFDDIGYIAGDGNKAYVITGNPLFYTNSKTDDMNSQCKNLFDNMFKQSYYTATLPMLSDMVTSLGKNYTLDCGSIYQIKNSDNTVQVFLLLRETITSKGVTFESVGSPNREQVSLSTDPNIIALNNKTNELVRDVNETKSTLTTVTTTVDNMTTEVSEIKQTSEEISSTVSKVESKVDKNTGDITELTKTTSEIKQTADGLTSTVTKNTNDITELSSTLSQTADEIRQEVNGKVDGDDVQSAIVNNLNGLTLSYNNSDVSGDNSCYITLSKDGVSIGGLVQMTNVTADTISASNITAGTLDADDISVNNSFAVKVNGTTYGYVGAALGSDASGSTTYGATLRSADGNSYVIVTNGGVRLQKGNTSIWVTDEGISYRINGGNVVPVGYAVFS